MALSSWLHKVPIGDPNTLIGLLTRANKHYLLTEWKIL